MRSTRARVMFVQPYLPTYREPFFKALSASLGDSGIDIRVAHPIPSPEDLARADSSSIPGLSFHLESTRIRLAGRTLGNKDLVPAIREFNPSHVVVEQAIKNLETWKLLFTPQGGIESIAMWGQGRTYSTPQGPIASWLKSRMTCRADWFFSYTERGAQWACEHGFPAERVSVVQNSNDMERLIRDLGSITAAEELVFREKHSAERHRTALFLGGVDSRKGIDFLLESVGHIAEMLPGFRLLVAGEGNEVWKVRRASDLGLPITHLGRLEGIEKALALHVADVLAIPQWVGLVAVDSLASGTPIVTTKHPSHSPEFEYLESDISCLVTDHQPKSYGQAIAEILLDHSRRQRLSEACLKNDRNVSMSDFVQRFAQGVEQWVGQ